MFVTASDDQQADDKKSEKKEKDTNISDLTASREELRKNRDENLEIVNNAYEELKYLNEIQGKEEQIEKKIKEEEGLNCFTKIDNKDITIICISDKHDINLANKIMRRIQKEYKEKQNIIVKFQKK